MTREDEQGRVSPVQLPPGDMWCDSSRAVNGTPSSYCHRLAIESCRTWKVYTRLLVRRAVASPTGSPFTEIQTAQLVHGRDRVALGKIILIKVSGVKLHGADTLSP